MVEFLSNFLTPKKSRSPSSNNRASPAFDFQFEIPENPVRFESPQLQRDEYGYVFVILGDLTKINCDYWLGPTGAGLDPSIQTDFPRSCSSVEFVEDLGGKTWKQKGFMGPLRTYAPWPSNLPQPFSIGLHSKRGETESYIGEIVRFIRAAAYHHYWLKPQGVAVGNCSSKKPSKSGKSSRSSPRDNSDADSSSSSSSSSALLLPPPPQALPLPPPPPPRAVLSSKARQHVCPLIAVPLLGTGSGGNYLNTGKMTKALLPVLYQLCDELFVDIAVITIEEDVYKLVQACRHTFFAELEKKKTAEAEAARARKKNLGKKAQKEKRNAASDEGGSVSSGSSSSSAADTLASLAPVPPVLESVVEGMEGLAVASNTVRVEGSTGQVTGTETDDVPCAVADGGTDKNGDNDGADLFAGSYADWRFGPYKELARRGAPRGAIEYAMDKDGCSEDEVASFLSAVSRRRAISKAPSSAWKWKTAPAGDTTLNAQLSSSGSAPQDCVGTEPDCPMSWHDTISGLRYLSPEVIHKKIPFLLAKATHGELSLFLGAGASMGAGLPSWGELLDSIAKEIGVDGEYLEEFNSLDYYTKAAVLEHRINKQNSSNSSALGTSKKTLSQMVAEKTTSSRYSVVHALLAAMPVSEIITTNYDDLLEKCLVLSGPFAVLPAHPQHGCKKWLLKMHGCVTRPHEIVFTKRDYIRYGERFAALGGIVQSMLLTKHLLFVGFSLDDDNFVRIFDSVRKACEDTESSESVVERGFSSIINPSTRKRMKSKYKAWNKLSGSSNWTGVGENESGATGAMEQLNSKGCGTALLLEHSVWKEEMWQDQIGMIFMQKGAGPDARTLATDAATAPQSKSKPQSKGEELAKLARKQEILLDILSAACSRCAATSTLKFLMNGVYEDALSAGELEMKQFYKKLMADMNTLSDDAKNSGPYMQLEDLVKDLRPPGGGGSGYYYGAPPSKKW